LPLALALRLALALALALASGVGVGVCVCVCVLVWRLRWRLCPSLAVGRVVCRHHPQPPHEQLLVAEVWEWHGEVESGWVWVLS